MTQDTKSVTAAMIIIGNEVLSGRTQDKNLAFVAKMLGEIGIDMLEARVIPDELDVVVAAVNELRARYDYIFTSGGIGPTHDDITADCIAAAFGVKLEKHPLAMQALQAHYDAQEADFNEARQRMARIPEGASLIENPVSTAPGFKIENGEISFPINEVTIADNLNDMFKKMIIANDLEFLYSINTPTLAIEGMTIAGV